MPKTEEYVLLRDEIVKKLFTNPRVGKRYSASVIASVLNVSEEEIYNNLEYVDPKIGANTNIVNSETDITYETDKTLINIEFNVTGGTRTYVKNESYICQLYLRQLPSNYEYRKLKPIIQINIDAYDYFKKNKFLYHSVLMEKSLHLVDNINIQIYHINLPFLREMDYNELRSDASRLKELLYILVCSDEKSLNKMYEGDRLMEEVRNEIKRDMKALDAWLYYDREYLQRMDLEDARDEARKIGREAGLKEGHEAGLKEGHEAGLKEGHTAERLEIAKNMLAEHISVEVISKITGLSPEELEKLK